MGIFDAFLGKSQKRDLQAGKASADAAASSGYRNATQALKTGQADASGYINAGITQAADAIRTGTTGANAQIGQSYGKARGEIDDYLKTIEGNFEQFITGGTEASDRYKAALGLSGADARADFNEDYNDGYQGDAQYTYDQLARQAAAQSNAAGGYAGGFDGRGYRAVSDAYQRQFQNDKNTYLDRLERAGSRGQEAAGQLSSFQAQGGQTKASLHADEGTRIAGNLTNQGNSLADLFYRGNSALAGNAMSVGQSQSSLDAGYGQTQADRNTSYSNALASTRSTGWNNLINLAGTAAKATSGTNLADLFKKKV